MEEGTDTGAIPASMTKTSHINEAMARLEEIKSEGESEIEEAKSFGSNESVDEDDRPSVHIKLPETVVEIVEQEIDDKVSPSEASEIYAT